MKRICAWCRATLDAGPPEDDGRITHGICDGCAGELQRARGLPLEEFVERLGAPVLLVDADHTVGLANGAAREVYGSAGAPLVGRRAGDVFECENARLPGGCGRTIHCSGCAIRRSIAHTQATGEPLQRVPATLRTDASQGPGDVELLISTARVGRRILLKVERPAGDRG